MASTATVAKRIAKKVQVDAKTGCHVWRGAKSETKYTCFGIVWYGNKLMPVPRVIWEYVLGKKIPDGCIAAAKCGTKLCVNPEHLGLEVVAREGGGFRDQTTETRFWGKVHVEPNTGCWLWRGMVIPSGYGYFRNKKGKLIPAYRFSYELHKGKIPKKLVLDHLCRQPYCVNPDHLEPVTHKINIQRGWTARKLERSLA